MNKCKFLTLLFLLISGVKSNADRAELYDSSSPNEADQTQTTLDGFTSTLNQLEVSVQAGIMKIIVKNNGIDLNTLADSVTTFQAEAMLMHLMEQVMEEAKKKKDNETYQKAQQIFFNQQFIELSKQEDTEASNIIKLQELLIINGVDVNAQGIKRRTALYYAEKLENHKTKQFLLENKADVNLAQNGVDDNTKATVFGLPILWLYAHPNIAYNLIQLEADVNSPSSMLHAVTLTSYVPVETFLQQTKEQEIKNKQADVVEFLIRNGANNFSNTVMKVLIDNGFDPNAKDKYARTTLHYAADNGQLEIVNTILKKRATSTIIERIKQNIFPDRDEDGRTPLYYAAENGHIEVMKSLKESGAKINIRDNYNITPLHLAVANKQLEAVKYLKENGAKINAKDNQGRMPLHWVAEHGQIEMVKYLKESGAKIEAKDIDGRTPLHWAAEHGQLEMVKYLKENRAKINAKDKAGRIPLHLAAENGHLETVKYLKENGAKFDTTDKSWGYRPVHEAAENGHLEIVKYLIESGDNIEAQTKNSQTPLHLAAENGHLEIVKYLIESRANIEATDFKGKTALDYAKINKHHDTVEILEIATASNTVCKKLFT